MKRLAPALASLLLPVSTLFADLTTPFTAPPFVLNASIIGREGWEMRLPGTSDDGTIARLVAVRWDNFRPAACLDGVSIKNDFPATQGSRVRVTLRVAFTFAPGSGTPPLAQARFLFGGSPFGEIVFASHSEGGLGFGDGTGRDLKVAVPVKELRSNSFYDITLLVDYDRSAYDVTITGTKADGTPLSYEEKNVGFVSQTGALKGAQIISAKTVRVYLQDLRVESL